jgi:hypothetical protein
MRVGIVATSAVDACHRIKRVYNEMLPNNVRKYL